jgi:ligand-binding sensor domain-containing protein
VAIDKKGFLWIGTIDGLNVYDGYAVTVFKKESQPAMASDNAIHLTCDSKNRIWLAAHEGITRLDKNRKFYRVMLNDSTTKFFCRTIMDTKKPNLVLYTRLRQYFFEKNKTLPGSCG